VAGAQPADAQPVILGRYIGLNMLKGWLLVLLVLGAVFGLLGFIEELDHTRLDYDALAVARYTLFSLPQRLVNLAPVIVLLGSILALANLARSNELTIIRCTGMSPAALLGAIALPTLLLMLLLWLCMEFVSPRLQFSAERERTALRYHNEVEIPDGGVWSTDGRRYTHVATLTRDGVPGNIDLFEFDRDGQLLRALHAKQAEPGRNRQWRLLGVREKRLENGELVTRRHRSLEVANLWTPDELPALKLSSETMTLSVLYRYSDYLASTGQPGAQRYLGAFWQKLLMPLTVCAMVLLATPIAIGRRNGRERSFGLSMALGALVGVLFYLGAQVVFALGQLLGLSLPLVALAPALLVGLCAAVLLWRMNW
jgi:lipopolysaccharide export system permease protein